jgi:dihydrofolate synthase/folylpolyglutamate synthase
VVLDVAHNEQGISQVLSHVNQLQIAHPSLRIHWIMGMVKDKDIHGVLSLLPDTFQYYFTQAHLPRALPAAELQQMASEQSLRGHAFGNVNDALETAMQVANKQDIIIVCGSVFVVGEVDKTIFENKPDISEL